MAIDLKEFVKAWEQAENVDAVATALKLKKTQCQSIASKLRKAKVDLKQFRVGMGEITTKDAKELNALINKIRQA